MEYRKMNIKEGVNLHTIKTEIFKTNLLAVYLSSPLTKKEVTQKALSMAIIRRGTENLKTQEDIRRIEIICLMILSILKDKKLKSPFLDLIHYKFQKVYSR